MKNWKILIFLIALAAILGMLWYHYRSEERITIVTDKEEYKPEDNLKVVIRNDSSQKICFSSCYPYYLERRNGQWESYKYVECFDFDSNGNCIQAKKEQAFELILPKVEEGLHRLAIPVCMGCESAEEFKEDQRFYSNEFWIK